jgi:hypothetical protein
MQGAAPGAVAMNDRSSRADHFRANLVLGGFLLVGAFYLLTEHRAHLFGILPYLIFLACPMMHLFIDRKSVV